MAVGDAARLSSYEIEVYLGGRWRSAGAYPDRDSAIDEAKSLAENPRYASVKVVSEQFDEGEQLFVRRTVYRSAPVKDESELREAKAVQAYQRYANRHRQRKAQEQARLDSRRNLRKQRRKGTLFAIGMIGRVLLIAGIGLGLLYWILSQY